MLQGRDPEWTGRPFFAKYDENATWFDDLVPAFGEPHFFFEPAMRKIERTGERSGSVDHSSVHDHQPGVRS